MRRRTSARRPDIPSCGRTAAAGCRPWKLREILAGELLDIPALLIGPFGDIPLGKGIVMFVDHRRRFVVDGALPRHGNLDAPLGREIHHRHGAGLAQRVAHGGVDDLPHGLLVVELHLDFLGMDIDVDPFGVDRKEEEIGGETGIGNQLLISFQHRLAQVLVAEIASVDEEVLLGIALFGRRRTPHEPVDANDRRVGRNLQQIGFDMATHHVDDPPGQRSRLQTVYGNIIVVQLERHGGIA